MTRSPDRPGYGFGTKDPDLIFLSPRGPSTDGVRLGRRVGERIWLVTLMHDDLGYFDDEAGRLEPIENPFGAKVLPMSSE